MNSCIKSFLGLFVLWNMLGFSRVYAVTDLSGPGTLSKAGETYRLTRDISSTGTAFTITGNNITLDLNGHTVTAATSSSGYGIVVSGSNNKVFGGMVVVGGGSQVNIAGIYITGSNNEVYYNQIRANGGTITGDVFVNTVRWSGSTPNIHHNFCYASGHSTALAYAVDNIAGTGGGATGARVHDNVIVGGHRGIDCTLVGNKSLSNPRSYIYNNYIQNARTGGVKQPMGISVTESNNFDVYGNQVISDDSRGISICNWGNGSAGITGTVVYNNRVDVGYTLPAQGGQYPENHVNAVRSRYGAYGIVYRDNIFIVDNAVAGGQTECLNMGSDTPDNQANNQVINNVLINHDRSNTWSGGIAMDCDKWLLISGNQYYGLPQLHGIWYGEWAYTHDGGANYPPTVTGNTNIAPTSYVPGVPTGLSLRKFFNSYLLTWNLLNESQTYEYYVYRDGSKIPGISSRGGSFYIDPDATGTHTYQVSAVNLNGQEGAPCAAVSTNAATDGWRSGAESETPKSPIGLRTR